MNVTVADDDGRPHDAAADVVDVEFVAVDGSLAGLVRVDVRPASGATRFLAAVLRPGRDPVVVIDYDLPLVTDAFEFRAPAVWVELVCEEPLEFWTVGLEAFGLALDDRETATPDSFGDRVPVGLDLDVEAAGPAEVEPGGFRIPVAVHGQVLVGDDAYEIAAVGNRRRRWDGARPSSVALDDRDPLPAGELWVSWPASDGGPTVEGRGWVGGPRPGWRALPVQEPA